MAEYIEKQDIYNAVDLLRTRFPYRVQGIPETYNKAWFDACSLVLDLIKNYPPADVRPVAKGRWEDCSSGWMCSNCSWTQIRESNYCPNCGADMREGDVD